MKTCRRKLEEKQHSFDGARMNPASFQEIHNTKDLKKVPARKTQSFFDLRNFVKQLPMMRFLFDPLQVNGILCLKKSLCFLPLILLTSFFNLNAQVIDFESEIGWMNGSPYDGNPPNNDIYEIGNLRFTVNDATSWIENNSLSSGTGSNAIAAATSADPSTITIETIDGSELSFQSFISRAPSGTDIGQIEGFRDAGSTGVQTTGVTAGSVIGGTLITLDNAIFSNVDRVVISSAGAGFQQVFDDLTFGPVPTPPSVTTNAATDVEEVTTTLNGDVTADGGATITERGFLYSLTADDADPMIGDPMVIQQTVSGTTGAFSFNATGLTPTSGYSFRAYAINSEGTTLGSILTFTTGAINNPTVDTNLGLTVDEGATGNITAAELTTSDGFQGPGELTYTVQASATVSNGTLFLDVNGDDALDGGDTDLSGAGSTFTQQNIDDGDIFYEHDGSETPLTDGFDFIVTDGTTGTTASTSFAITINAVNDAPVLADEAVTLTAIDEDNTTSTGDDIATIVVDGSITDADGSAVEAIAVLTVDNTDGVWQFSIDNGGNWVDFSATTGSNVDITTAARLLDGTLGGAVTQRIRFVPDADFNGTSSFTFAAWDRSLGSAGGTLDASVRGTTTPFSTFADNADITVNAINDAPVLADAAVTLTAIDEDNFTSNGDDIATIVVDGSITDADGSAVEAIAVLTVDNTDGVWQFSIDNGGNWVDFSATTGSNVDITTAARLLDGTLGGAVTQRIRFVPDANFNGTSSFTFAAWDRSSGSAGGTLDASVRGTTTPFSTFADNADITVNAINNAPVLADGAVTLTAIDEDNTTSTGDDIATVVVDGSITDVDGSAVEAIAVLTVDNTDGVWQFSIDNGGNWVDFSATTGSNVDITSAARLLDGTLAGAVTQRIRFVPDANFNGTSSFTFAAWDRSLGSAGGTLDASVRGTTTPFSTFADNADITVNAINDAPVLADAAVTLTAIDEDNTTSTGDDIATIVVDGSITDVDGSAVEAIAVLTVDNTDGVWQFSIDNGGNWVDFSATTGSNVDITSAARLLDGTLAGAVTQRIRFVPDANFNGTSSFTFAAWDRSLGSAGGTLDASVRGTTTPFSTFADNADITVNAINDAPVLADAAVTLTAIDEDNTTSTGDDIATIVVDGSITDVDGSAVEAIAVLTVDNTDGVWQFSIDNGGNWVDFSATTGSNVDITSAARLLDGTLAGAVTQRIRFVPDADFNGTSSFTFAAWDRSLGSAGGTLDASVRGTTTPFSTFADDADITVNAINDAPVLADAVVTLTAIDEDNTTSTGDDIATIVVDGSITDADGSAVEAIAVLTVDNTDGVWQFSIDNGGNWVDFSATTGSNVDITSTARLLDGTLAGAVTQRIRFVPDANFNGTSSFTFAAWDRSSGSAGGTLDASVRGTTTPFSTFADDADITVNAINDAPVLADATVTLTAIDEDNFTSNGDDIAAIVVDGSITDVDGSAVEAIAVLTVDNTDGVWQFSIDNGGNWVDFSATTGSNVDITSTARLLDGTLAGAVTQSIRFVPDADFNGTSSFTFAAWDRSLGSAGGTLDASVRGTTTPFSTFADNADITVNAINDDPVVTGTVTSPFQPSEDVNTTFDIAILNVTDVDAGTGDLTLTLSTASGAEDGTLTAAADPDITIVGSPGTTITLTGELGDLNTYIDNSNISYQGPADLNGAIDAIDISITDNGNTGTGGGGTIAVQTVAVDIQAVNDAPSFTTAFASAVTGGSLNQSVSSGAIITVEDFILVSPFPVIFGPSDESGQAIMSFNVDNVTDPSGVLNGVPSFSGPNGSGNYDFDFQTNDNVNGVATIDFTVSDNGGTALGGVNTSTALSFTITVADNSGPGIVTLNPANGATGISANPQPSVVATFNENINLTTGFIRLSQNSVEIETIDVANPGTGQITIDNSGGPTSGLLTLLFDHLFIKDSVYAIEIDAGAIEDGDGNPFQSFTWSWTMEDGDAADPDGRAEVIGTFPANGAVGVSPGITSIFLNFDEPVRLQDSADEGITITATDTEPTGGTPDPDYSGGVFYNARTNGGGAGNPLVDVGFVPVNPSATFNGAGGDTGEDQAATIWRLDYTVSGPGVTFDESTVYTVVVGEFAFEDNGNASGPDDNLPFTFSFTTASDGTPPVVQVFTPADQLDFTRTVDAAATTSLSIDFDENIAAGSGNIQLFLDSDDDGVSNGTVFDITVGDGAVDITNDILTIDLTTLGVSLTGNVTYFVNVDNGAITDLVGNAYAGISDATTWNFSTLAETIDPANEPVLVSLNPADNSSGVMVNSNFVLEFDEPVDLGTTEEIRLFLGSNNALIETVSASALSVDNNLVTIDFANNLGGFTDYYITVASGAIRDFSGNLYAGFTNPITWNFNTESGNDNIDPFVTVVSPADGATNVSRLPTISLTFDAPVFAGTGTFTINDAGGVVESFDVSTDVTIVGNAVSFTSTVQLDDNVSHFVEWTAGVVTDAEGNDVDLVGAQDPAVITGGVWDFTTVQDAAGPMIVTLDPANDANNVTSDATFSLIIDFDEPVVLGSGNIQIFFNDGTTLVNGQTFDVSSDVALSNGDTRATLTAGPLDGNTEYYVFIPSGAFTDQATVPNNFAGISPDGTYSFTTVGDVSVPTLVNNSVSSMDPNGVINIMLEFNERVETISGGDLFIELGDADNTEVFRIEAITSSPDNSTDNEGSTYTYAVPAGTLRGGNTYFVGVENVAFEDASGNDFAGIEADGTFSFTTNDDGNAPIIVALEPVDGEPGAPLNTNLVITFDEPVVPNAGGMLSIFYTSSGELVEAIAVSTAVASVSNTVYTFTTATDLEGDTDFFLQLTAGAFEDRDGTPNQFAGILDQTTWNFTTTTGVNLPTAGLAPADGGIDFDFRDDLVLTFNEPVFVNAGNITIAGGADGNLVIPITDVTQVTGNGSTVITIDPQEDLFGGTAYTVTMDVGALQDASGNDYDLSDVAEAGADGWTFTTIDGILVVDGAANTPEFAACLDGSFITQGLQGIFTQDDIFIRETNNDDFRDINSTETIVLSLSTGFEFDITATPTIVNNNVTGDLSALSLAFNSATEVEITFTADATADAIDVIRIRGLEIRNTSGSLADTGTLTRTGGSADLYGSNAGQSISYLNLIVEQVAAPVLGDGVTAGTFNLASVNICEDNRVSPTSPNEVADFDIIAQPLASHILRWYDADGTTELVTTNDPTFGDLNIDITTPGDQVRFVSQLNSNGCESELVAFNVTILASPDPADFVGADALACNLEEITIGNINNGSASVAQFLWTSVDDTDFTASTDPNPTFVPLANPADNAQASRTYSVQVLDNDGCLSDNTDPDRSVTITLEPNIPVTINSIDGFDFPGDDEDPHVITGNRPTGFTGAFTGVGLGNIDVLTDPATASFVPSTAGSGTHTITYTLTEDATGCDADASVVINVSAAATIFADVNETLDYCIDDSPENVDLREDDLPAGITISSLTAFARRASDNTVFDVSAFVLTGTINMATGWVFDPAAISSIPDLLINDDNTVTLNMVRNVTNGLTTIPFGRDDFTVYSLPTVTINNLVDSYCEDSDPVVVAATVESNGNESAATITSIDVEVDNGVGVFNSIGTLTGNTLDFSDIINNTGQWLADGITSSGPGTYRITVSSAAADDPEPGSPGCTNTGQFTFTVFETPAVPVLDLSSSARGTFDTGSNNSLFQYCVGETPENLIVTSTNQINWFVDNGGMPGDPLTLVTGDVATNVSPVSFFGTDEPTAQTQVFHFTQTTNSNAGTGFAGCESDFQTVVFEIFNNPNNPQLDVSLNGEEVVTGTFVYEYCAGETVDDVSVFNPVTLIDNETFYEWYNTDLTLLDGLNGSVVEDDANQGPISSVGNVTATALELFGTDTPGPGTFTFFIRLRENRNDLPFGNFDGCFSGFVQIDIVVHEIPAPPALGDFTSDINSCSGEFDFNDRISTTDLILSPGQSDVLYTWYADNTFANPIATVSGNDNGTEITFDDVFSNPNVTAPAATVNDGGDDFYSTNTTYNESVFISQTLNGLNSITSSFGGCESTSLTEVDITIYPIDESPVVRGAVSDPTYMGGMNEVLNFSAGELTPDSIFTASTNFTETATNRQDFDWFFSNNTFAIANEINVADSANVTAQELFLAGLSNDFQSFFLINQTTNIELNGTGAEIFEGCTTDNSRLQVNTFNIPAAPQETLGLEQAFHCLDDVLEDHFFAGENGASVFYLYSNEEDIGRSDRRITLAIDTSDPAADLGILSEADLVAIDVLIGESPIDVTVAGSFDYFVTQVTDLDAGANPAFAGSESLPAEFEIIFLEQPEAPAVPTPDAICRAAGENTSVVIDIQNPGTGDRFVWFDQPGMDPFADIALAIAETTSGLPQLVADPTLAPIGTTTFYVYRIGEIDIDGRGFAGCPSAEVSVDVTVFEVPDAPSVVGNTNPQTGLVEIDNYFFCQDEDISAVTFDIENPQAGSVYNWYDVDPDVVVGAAPFTTGTSLTADQLIAGIGLDIATPGNISLFVTQTTNAICESPSQEVTITINEAPVLSLGGLINQVCFDDSPITIVGLNNGIPLGAADGVNASFTINTGGLVDNGDGTATITPSAAAAAAGETINGDVSVHTITYSFTNNNGCVTTIQEVFSVFPLPELEIQDSDGSLPTLTFCVDDADHIYIAEADGAQVTNNVTFLLDGDPLPVAAGQGTFSPSTVGEGTYTLTLRYVGESAPNCESEISSTIVVNPLPVLTIVDQSSSVELGSSGLDEFCFDPTSIVVLEGRDGGVAVNGDWRATFENGSGIFVDLPASVIPEQADNSAVFNINAAATSAVSTDPTLDDSEIIMRVFFGFTDGNQCFVETFSEITVNPLPTLDLVVGGIPVDGTEICINDDSGLIIQGTSEGINVGSGTFSINTPNPSGGFVDNGNGTASFDPAVIAADNGQSNTGTALDYVITFQFTDNNGCTNSIDRTITISPLPELEIQDVDGSSATMTFCEGDGNHVFVAEANGALVTSDDVVFLLDDVVQTTTGGQYTFIPPNDISAVETLELTIRYTNSVAPECTNETSIFITVNPLPELTIVDPADLDVLGSADLDEFCFDGPSQVLEGRNNGVLVNGVWEVQFLNDAGVFQTVTDLDVIPEQADGSAIFNPTVAAQAAGMDRNGTTETEVRIFFTFSDGNGCENIISADISINPQPNLGLIDIATNESVDNDLICFDAEVIDLRATNNGGQVNALAMQIESVSNPGATISGFNFDPTTGVASFNPSEIAESAGGSATGNPESFIITAEFQDDNTCEASKEFMVTISPQPELLIRNQDGSAATTLFCANDAVVTYEAVADGSTVEENVLFFLNDNPIVSTQGTVDIDPFTLIEDDPTTVDIESNELRLEFISGTDPFCNNSTSITLVVNPLPDVIPFVDPVDPDILNFADALKACEGDSVILSVSPILNGLTEDDFTYRWFAEGDLIAGADSSTLIDLVSRPAFEDTEYSLELTNDVTGCTASFDAFITVGPDPQPAFAFEGETINQPITLEFREDSGFPEVLITDRTLRVVNTSIGFDQTIDVTDFSETEGILFDTPGEYLATLNVLHATGCFNEITRTINVVNSIAVNNDGYFEDFESGDGGWFTDNILFDDRFTDQIEVTQQSSWQLGVPLGESVIVNDGVNRLATDNAWVTNLTGDYNSNENSFLYSPSFDLTGIDNPTISFDRVIDFINEQGTDEVNDGTIFQFSVDDGRSWANLGSIDANLQASGINWYNSLFIRAFQNDNTNNDNIGWSQVPTEGPWLESAHIISLGGDIDNVRFRIGLASDDGGVGEGFGFDNFRIFSRARNTVLETFSSILNTISRTANDTTFNILQNPLNSLDDVTWLNYFGDFDNNSENGRVDPLNDRDEITPSTLSTNYGINQAPRAVINGVVQNFVPANANVNDRNQLLGWTVTTLSNSSLSVPLVSIDIEELTTADDRVELNINVTSDTDFKGLPVELLTRVFIVEDSIDANLLNQLLETDDLLEGPVYNVVRESLPSPLGFEFSGQLDEDQVIGNYSVGWDVNNVFHPDRLTAVVYVQSENPDGSADILQSLSLKLSTKQNVVTSVQEQFLSGQDVAIFPNPASDQVNVAFDSPVRKEATLRLVDQTGKILRAETVPVGTQEMLIETSDLSAGVYFISVLDEDGKLIPRRLVIMRR